VIDRTIANPEMGIIIEGEVIYSVIKAKSAEEVMVAEDDSKINESEQKHNSNRNLTAQYCIVV